MTRQIMAILIVVAIIAVIVRVLSQSSTALAELGALVLPSTPIPTSALQVRAPDDNSLPTALPESLIIAVAATVQAATPQPVRIPGSTSRPLVLPNTGVLDGLGWPAQIPFVVFITVICSITIAGFWFGRNR